jgi:radical SAM superfamily enzyme YgiQ (UPF0313 family)
METLAGAQKAVTSLVSRRPRSGGAAPFLPMSRAEMTALGWDACDIVLVTGDAYVDHPSFGMAIIGRLLEAQGFRVGIISQPDWRSAEPFEALGRPTLFFGVTGGNLDSMVNRYTSDRRLRHDDAYTAGGEGGKRPDRCTIVYTQRCREAYKNVPVVLGGIEASLRRIAHYDYWSDKVRRSILADAKADLLIYGNAERAVVEVANRLAAGETPRDLDSIRGVALFRPVPEHYTELHADDLDSADEGASRRPGDTVIRLPAYEQVEEDREAYARASRVLHREANPGNARPLVQRHGDRDLWLNPPPIPLTSDEMDAVYDLPYARAPHPSYGDAKIPAWDMIKFSVTVIARLLRRLHLLLHHRARGPHHPEPLRGFDPARDRADSRQDTGVHRRDLGYRRADRKHVPDGLQGPKDRGGVPAAILRLSRHLPEPEYLARRSDPALSQGPRSEGRQEGDGRFRRALRPGGESPEYVKELVTHHVGGYLKIAPEHTERCPLDKMMKPGIGAYDHFKEMFDAAAKEASKKYYLIPYFIAAHPGTTDEDMMNLALWLKKNRYRADQVQTFLPSPMATATAMYHTGVNTLRGVRRGASDKVDTIRGARQRRLHKAFLRYHDPDNWPLLREALKEMGRADLIGQRPDQLVPSYQPPGTGRAAGTKRPARPNSRALKFTTKGVSLPKR